MNIKRKRYRDWFLPGFLVLTAIFTQVYHIDRIPLEMHIDEAGLGLNAWSLANYGTDRYGNFLPVCPTNFYGEQSAFYTYFCALFIRFFGLNLITLRLPGVIMGILTVLFGSLLIREKWGKNGFLIGLALLGICPYFIMNSRFALDCNAMLGAVTIALYALVHLSKKADKNSEKSFYGFFALTGLLFGIVLYTYIIAAIAVAIFCALFGIYYLFYQKDRYSVRFFRLFFLAIPLLVMVIPLILVVCVNYFGWEPVVAPFFSAPRMAVNRVQEVSFSLSAVPGKIRALSHILTTDGKYGSSDCYWTMYRHSVPFILVGVVFSVRDAWRDWRNQRFSVDVCILLFCMSEGILFLLCGQYNYHINGIFASLVYFCVNGLLFMLSFFRGYKSRQVYKGIVFLLYAGFFAAFAVTYYGENSDGGCQVFGGVEEALSLLTDQQKERDIYVMDEVGEFYFLSRPVSPAIFSSACDELGYIRDYGNLHFYEPDDYLEDDVYICSKSSGRYYFFSDPQQLGYTCEIVETPHCYVFYCK